MEDKRSPEPEDETLEKKLDSEFALSWFSRRAKQKESKETDDDDEEEDSTPYTLWQRAWRKLFRSAVKPTPVPETTERPAVSQPAWAEAVPLEPEEAPIYTADTSEAPEIQDVQPTEEYHDIPEQTPDFMADDDLDSDIADLTPETPLAESEADTTRPETEEHIPEERIYAAEPVAHLHREATPIRPEVVYERTREVIERGPSNRLAAVATVLVGGEYFARRRADRKLKREVERLSRQVKKGSQASQQLQKLKPEAAPRSPEITRDLKTPETKPVVTPITVEKIIDRTIQVERPTAQTVEAARPIVGAEKLIVERTVEAQKPSLKELEPTAAAVETTVESRKAPEVVLETVVKAAERDAPIERLYERRHEIKDEPTRSTGAAAIGSLLTPSTPFSMSSYGHKGSSDKTASLDRNLPTEALTTPSLYKQAVQAGFWAAMVIMVVAAISLMTVR